MTVAWWEVPDASTQVTVTLSRGLAVTSVWVSSAADPMVSLLIAVITSPVLIRGFGS